MLGPQLTYDAREIFVAETELFEHAGGIVLDHDVRFRHELSREISPLRIRQVERNELLSGVPIREPRRELGLDAELGCARWDVESGDVGKVPGLDLDHLGAAPCHEASDPRPRQPGREFDDPQPSERVLRIG